MFRYGSPLYEKTKIVGGIGAIHRICVSSSQYAVVVHENGKRMSLVNLTTASEIIKPLHTIEITKWHSDSHGVVAVARNWIAVTNGKRIQFYYICGEKLIASTARDIELKGELLDLDCHDEKLFLSLTEDYSRLRIVQTDFEGNVLKTFIMDEKIGLCTNEHCVSYNPVTKLIYLSCGWDLYAMALNGGITEIDSMEHFEDITVSETGNMYLVGRDGMYMVSIGTHNAVKFGKKHSNSRTSITYEREQKKVYVACEDYIDIFTII